MALRPLNLGTSALYTFDFMQYFLSTKCFTEPVKKCFMVSQMATGLQN